MENIYYSSAAAITELVFTHPIDYYKTLKQNNKSNLKKIILSNPYRGVSSRLIGILPMRISFWSSLDYLKNKNYNPLFIPLITSTIQTIIDIPIEQLKINLMNKKSYNYIPENFIKGGLYHYQRNIIFTYGFYLGTQITDNAFVGGVSGGLLGSVLSHPLDSLKTFYQSGNNNPNITREFLLNGLIPRTSISVISMSIGYGSFIFFKNLFS